jgi:hypothetical protein
MFRALLAHPQEALHKRHLVYCVSVMSVGCTRCALYSFLKSYCLFFLPSFHYPDVFWPSQPTHQAAFYFPCILLYSFFLSPILFKTSFKTETVLSSWKPKFTHQSAWNINLGTEHVVSNYITKRSWLVLEMGQVGNLAMPSTAWLSSFVVFISHSRCTSRW